MYHSFLGSVDLPNAEVFNYLIPCGEMAIGLGLILGCLTTYAAFFGIVMNFSFLMSGTVSTTPQYLFLLMLLPIAIARNNAGEYRLDRYVTPIFTYRFNNNNQTIAA